MAGYSTPGWNNGASPAINAANLTAIGQAIELAQHPYGVCGTAAATAAKAVTIDFSGTLSLFTGLTVRIKFTYANKVASPTLNVNGTGDKAIFCGGAAAKVDAWAAGDIVALTYDGTRWNASVSSSAPFVVSATAPSDTSKLWIDTANGLKYYDGSNWVIVPVAYYT